MFRAGSLRRNMLKISGMIDESMDKEQMKQPPKPWNSAANGLAATDHYAWRRNRQRYAGLFHFYYDHVGFGRKIYSGNQPEIWVYADSLGKRIGVKDGDKIMAVAGKPIQKVGTVGSEIIYE